MVESYIILSVVMPIFTIMTGFIIKLHINKCRSLCCDSDCTKTPPTTPTTPPNTPTHTPTHTPNTHKKEFNKISSISSI